MKNRENKTVEESNTQKSRKIKEKGKSRQTCDGFKQNPSYGGAR